LICTNTEKPGAGILARCGKRELYESVEDPRIFVRARLQSCRKCPQNRYGFSRWGVSSPAFDFFLPLAPQHFRGALRISVASLVRQKYGGRVKKRFRALYVSMVCMGKRSGKRFALERAL